MEGREIKNLLFLQIHVLVAKGTAVGSKISVNIFPLWKIKEAQNDILRI